MLVVIAPHYDLIARVVVSRWENYGAAQLTGSDLAVIGWRHYLNDAEKSTAAVGGHVVLLKEITAVLTRLSHVDANDLLHIVPEDRAYVAAEMTAFLLSWLTELRCPVLNRPTPGCLAGPAWRPAQWIKVAAGLGLSVRPWHRHVTLSSGQPWDTTTESPEAVTTVTVVGNHTFGAVDSMLVTHARRLADVAGARLLAVHFDGRDADATFLGADPWPDIAAPDVSDAILEYLTRGAAC